MEKLSQHVLILSLVLFAGVSLNRFSKLFKMPILICFLLVGIVCGHHGLNLFPEMKISMVQSMGEIALCFIIFTGGLETSFKAVKSVFVTGTILSTVGVVLTAMIMGCISYLATRSLPMLQNPPFLLCLVGGAVVASTDAAAVFAIIRGQKASINPRLQNLLEYESGSNDPAAFLLTSILAGLVVSGSQVNVLGISLNVAWGIVWGIGMGSAVGFLVGIAGQWFFNWIHNFLEYNGLRFVIAVAIVLFCYGITEMIFHANVLMACYVAGITMGNLRFNFKQNFISFHNGISWLMQILLFVSLGCFFDYRKLFDFKNMFITILSSLAIMFIARPAAVLLCMIRSPFTMKERIFTCWVGIRGSAPIMLSAVVMNMIPPGENFPTDNLFYVCFTSVLFSILIQGSSIIWVAKKLGLLLPFKAEAESLLEYNERNDGREMVEFTVRRGNRMIGCPLIRPEHLGERLVLLMLRRGEQILQPSPQVIVQENDIMTFIGVPEEISNLHENFFPEEEYSSQKTFRQAYSDFIGGLSKRKEKLVSLWKK